MSEPTVVKTDDVFSTVSGTFYRAVDPGHEADVLCGSRIPGRYSPADAPTLYVSSSRDGVSVAMRAHSSQRSTDLNVVTLLLRRKVCSTCATLTLWPARASTSPMRKLSRRFRPAGADF